MSQIGIDKWKWGISISLGAKMVLNKNLKAKETNVQSKPCYAVVYYTGHMGVKKSKINTQDIG